MAHYDADLCRLYINSKHDIRKLWSIDFGEGTEEIEVADVGLVSVSGWTGTNLTADNVGEPLAWIHFRRVTIDVDASQGLGYDPKVVGGRVMPCSGSSSLIPRAPDCWCGSSPRLATSSIALQLWPVYSRFYGRNRGCGSLEAALFAFGWLDAAPVSKRAPEICDTVRDRGATLKERQEYRNPNPQYLDQHACEPESDRSTILEALGAAVIRNLERYRVGTGGDLPLVAWTSRTIFELEIMLAFVTASADNLKSFANDVVLDEIQVREAAKELGFDRRNPEVALRQDEALERLRARGADLRPEEK